MENQEMKQESKPIEIQIADIVNATRIMEYAISKNVFTVKELSEVSPIVARFQDFVAAVQSQEKQPQAETQVESIDSDSEAKE